MIEFGEKLRLAREAKGLTQKTIADMVFVTRQTISRYENGERYPDLLTLKKLANILEVSIDYLLDENEMPKVVEKNPIIEKPIINNLIIVLYASIVLTYMYLGINNAPTNEETYQIMIDEVKAAKTVFNIHSFSEISEILILLYGFIMALQDKLNPKRTGIISILFLLFEAFETSGFLSNNNFLMPLLIMSPYVFGAIASYYFYFKQKDHPVIKTGIIASSAYGIFRAFVSVYGILMYADHLYSAVNTIGLILTVFIYILFIYQMLVLNNRRKLLKQTT